MCSTISIPISPKIPKIILRKSSDQFDHFGARYSANNWENLAVITTYTMAASYGKLSRILDRLQYLSLIMHQARNVVNHRPCTRLSLRPFLMSKIQKKIGFDIFSRFFDGFWVRAGSFPLSFPGNRGNVGVWCRQEPKNRRKNEKKCRNRFFF